MKKRGIFFSIDALVALTMIILVILIAYPLTKFQTRETNIHYDVLRTLSTLKVGETNNAFVQGLVTQGIINNTNHTLLEQIGEFYVTNQTLAKQFTASVLAPLETNENIGIWYGGLLVFSENRTSFENAKNIQTARQIISGIGGLNNTNSTIGSTGFSARGYLSNSLRKKYFYFGGYVGDGNLTARIEYYGNITSAEMELAINNNFTLSINGNTPANYQASQSETAPGNYSISTMNYFHSGNNTLEFKGKDLRISGGFIKISYKSDVQYQQPTKYYLPGIEGLINIYDGLYVPGNLSSLKISLHYNSNNSLFMNIGNVTIFNQSSAGETTTVLENTLLSSQLDYQSLSKKTTPLRLGMLNLSFITNGTGNADIVLITDVSGSMNWRMDSDTATNSFDRSCSDPLLFDPSTKRLSVAKCLDKDFVAAVLNSGGNNKIALVSFDNVAIGDTPLTSDQNLLNSTINNYSPGGTTCIACAINEAYKILQTQSSSTRKKFVVVMTDGAANTRATKWCSLTDVETEKDIDYITGDDGGFIHLNNTDISKWADYYNGSNVIYSVSPSNATFSLASGDSGKFYRWQGAQWTETQDAGSINFYGIDLLNQSFGFSVGSSGKIYQWDGNTWSQNIDNGNQDYRSVSVQNTTYNVLITGYSGSTGQLLKWNGGTSWTTTTVNNIRFYDVKHLNGTFALAVGQSGKIYRWNGVNWAEYQDTGSQTWYALSVVNSTLAYVAGSGGAIYRWQGATFSSFASPTTQQINGISFENNSNGRIITSNNLIYAYTGGAWVLARDARYTGTLSNGADCGDDYSCGTSFYNNYAAQNANWSSCRIHNDLNSTVYSIGFGPVATCALSATTLQSVANCGNGSYFASSNASQLQQIYQNISQSILQLSFAEQTAQAIGNLSGKLYEDSYIEFDYVKEAPPFGLIITNEKRFDNADTGTLEVPLDAKVLETLGVSYSGSKWTSLLSINNQEIYNLTKYGSDYLKLGDPYAINIPNSQVTVGANNTIRIAIAASPQNQSSGSLNNKIIYTLVRNTTSYSGIVAAANGCNWTIQFEDNTNLTTTIPMNYTGIENCYYIDPMPPSPYNTNDAFQIAVFNLLRALDLNLNNKVDLKFTQEDIQIALSQLTGIPFTWSTEVQVRVWD